MDLRLQVILSLEYKVILKKKKKTSSFTVDLEKHGEKLVKEES